MNDNKAIMATRENAEYVCLEGLKHGNRFYSNNEPEIDPTLSAEGELWYRVLGYADSSDEALSIIASAPRVPTQRDEINHRAYLMFLRSSRERGIIMRCTQIMGKTDEAMLFINNHAIKESKQCPHCGGPIESGRPKVVSTIDASHEGMFGDGPILNVYIDQDGNHIEEVVQATPWSSGPCIFICLKYKNKLICKWDQEAIDNC